MKNDTNLESQLHNNNNNNDNDNDNDEEPFV